MYHTVKAIISSSAVEYDKETNFVHANESIWNAIFYCFKLGRAYNPWGELEWKKLAFTFSDKHTFGWKNEMSLTLTLHPWISLKKSHLLRAIMHHHRWVLITSTSQATMMIPLTVRCGPICLKGISEMWTYFTCRVSTKTPKF
ncbi:hypothetical protein ABFS83_02G087400 [Erythranthe nasuta]